MQVWSLSSGSSGNCYLVREGSSLLLLEAGIGIRRLQHEMMCLGQSLSRLAAVVVTHEHGDHWQSAVAVSRRYRIPLLCTAGTLKAGVVDAMPHEHLAVPAGCSVEVGGFTLESFALPHDAREPVGFYLLSPQGASLCLATDMGYATEEVVERARDADLVILESNHDVEMLKRGPYPAMLKARILGDRGHISNEEAGRTLIRLAGGRPHCFWLAHLSHTNNTPRVALSTVQAALRREGLDNLKIEVALRDRRSLSWDSEAALTQLALF